MKKAKFEQGQSVTLADKQSTIKVVKKDFSSGAISYRLDDGSLVAEEQLAGKEAPKVAEDTTKADNAPKAGSIEAVRAEYKKVIGKDVAASKKNNQEWMEDKIKNAKVAALEALDYDTLMEFVEDGEIDIDVEDYEDRDELLQAVMEELELL